MPVRKVSNRGGNIIGYFPSNKMKRMIAFESTIERDEVNLLDYDKEVLAFEEQPLAIPYKYKNKTVTYTPDFLVIKAHFRILVECKPAALIRTEDNQRKFDIARSWCKEHDYKFEVATDEQIRSGFRLQNVKRLTQCARHVVSPQVKSHVYSILHAAQGPMTVADLTKEIAPANPPSAISSIFHLAYHHKIALALDEAKLGETSSIWLPSQSLAKE